MNRPWKVGFILPNSSEGLNSVLYRTQSFYFYVYSVNRGRDKALKYRIDHSFDSLLPNDFGKRVGDAAIAAVMVLAVLALAAGGTVAAVLLLSRHRKKGKGNN